MQPPFPTKKFFIVLLFLVLVGIGGFQLFTFLKNRSAEKANEEQKLAVVQKALLEPANNIASDIVEEKPVATSTLNAVAAVVYLSEQTKANGKTMEEITAGVGKQIQEAKEKLDGDAYSKNDILVNGDNSPEAIKKYGNDMAGIFMKYGHEEPQKETYLDIIKRALETKNKKEFAKLDPHTNFQKNIVRDALVLVVPSSVAPVHLHIINAFAENIAILQGFQNALDDVPSLVAANSRLGKAAERFIGSLKEADEFFRQNGIVFLPEEAGAIFADIAK